VVGSANISQGEYPVERVTQLTAHGARLHVKAERRQLLLHESLLEWRTEVPRDRVGASDPEWQTVTEISNLNLVCFQLLVENSRRDRHGGGVLSNRRRVTGGIFIWGSTVADELVTPPYRMPMTGRGYALRE
jgi:hypothetical protein